MNGKSVILTPEQLQLKVSRRQAILIKKIQEVENLIEPLLIDLGRLLEEEESLRQNPVLYFKEGLGVSITIKQQIYANNK